jgi:subtilisin
MTAFLFLLSSFSILIYIGQSSSFPINANATSGKDCGKDCGGGGSGGDKGSVKPSDNGGGGSGGDKGSVKPSDNGGGSGDGKNKKNKNNDNGGGGAGVPDQSCPKEDRGPNGICSHTETVPFTPRCPEGTSEVISNGERSCMPQRPGGNQACPEGTVPTKDLGCRPAKDIGTSLTSYNGTAHGTLTVKKIVSTTKKLIPDASYLITPNPHTLQKSLIVYDNDKNDFNSTKGVLVLKNITFSPYVIQERVPHQIPDRILHEARISVNEWLPNPILDIVEDNNLAKPLPDIKIPFQYIVLLKDNVTADPKSIADKFIAKGAELIHVYRYSFNGFAIRIPNLGLLDEMVSDPEIAMIEQDKIGRIASSSALSDFHHQTIPTGLKRIDENIQYDSSSINHTQSIKASQSNHASFVDADIAILDTGISKSHPDLDVYRDVTFVKNSTSGDDDNGHGSHAAGTAAAKDNSLGIVGVAAGARLWAIKVCDGTGRCPISNLIKGLDYVTQHADEIDVVNLSIENPVSVLLDKAVSKAVAAGVTVVTAAGNSAVDAKSTSPAHNPDVISVSAIADSDGKCGGLGRLTIGGADDRFANFSNFGPSVDIAAPGVDILSTYYRDEYGLESGTSMAAPHVAGYVAFYKSHHPLATPTEVKSALLAAGSLPTTLCNGKSHGYFFDDVDTFREPLLYINNQVDREQK